MLDGEKTTKKKARRRRRDLREEKTVVATLLYDASFVEGVRVLGRSLKTVGDKVVVTTKAMWTEALELKDWKPVEVPEMATPAAKVSSDRLRLVYTKLAVFNLTQFTKVLYVDADALVFDANEFLTLLKCPATFCAVLRHAELFNTGVFVARPSVALANDMARKIPTTFSYTGGDQGFLNSYFDGFHKARYFDPRKKFASFWDDDDFERCLRLPGRFNGDWPLLFVRGQSDIVVAHLTLGAVKPWTWGIAPFLPTVAAWQSYLAPRGLTFTALAPAPWVALLLFGCRRKVPLRRHWTRTLVSFGLLLISGRIAITAGSPRQTAAANWTLVSFWFCLAYLGAFAAYAKPSSRSFLIFAVLFVAHVIAFLAAPTIFLFGDKGAHGDLTSLLCILVPILYAFVVLNTTAAVLLLPSSSSGTSPPEMMPK